MCLRDGTSLGHNLFTFHGQTLPQPLSPSPPPTPLSIFLLLDGGRKMERELVTNLIVTNTTYCLLSMLFVSDRH